MTDTYSGVISGVYGLGLGDRLAAPATVGVTSLQVYDVCDFDDDEGGFLRLNDTVLAYTGTDDDTSTIFLADPLTVSANTDDLVEVWDASNNTTATVYKAIVDQIDGFDGNPVEAVIAQGLAHAFAMTSRDGVGESVTLVREDGELTVVAVHGREFSLAAVQYLQGGMTTRQTEDEAGVDILGAESGSPGIAAYGAGGTLSALIDALAGQHSFIGELGTALPGDIGVFMFSPSFSRFGVQHTQPTVQFNTGAANAQPQIIADAAGAGSGLAAYSGAGAAERQSVLSLDNGSITAGVERNFASYPDLGTYFNMSPTTVLFILAQGAGNGAELLLQNEQIILQTDYQFGTTDLAAVLLGSATAYIAGYRNNTDGSIQGMWLTRGGDLNLTTKGSVNVTLDDGTAFQPINASAFNVSSDPASKTDIGEAPDAVAIIKAAPAKRWRYKTDPVATRRIGPMADDLPGWLVGKRPKRHKVAPGEKYIDLARQNGVLWAAVGQQAQQIDDLTARVARLEQLLAEKIKED